MAITTDVGLRQVAPASFALMTAGDRSREFLLARRRTTVVRLLRWALPGAGIVLFGGYVAGMLETAGWGAGLPGLSIRKILPEDLTMHNPRYEGFGKDGSSYAFTAVTAQQDLAKLTQVKLNGITGVITQPDKTKTNIAAVRGTFDHKADILELFERIDVDSESGLKATLTSATFAMKKNLLTSNEPVLVEFPAGTIRSKTMTLKQKTREVAFIDAVEAQLKAQPKAKDAGQQAASGLFAHSDAPVEITSNRLDVNDTAKLAVFSGAVSAKQADATLSTPVLEVTYEGEAVAGAARTPAPSPASRQDEGAAGSGAASGKVRRIVAKEPVVIVRGETDRVTCANGDFDAINETGVLTGNVVMTSGTDRRATSDRVDLDQRADTALLTGNVVVVQGKNRLEGRRLFVDRKAGRTQLTSPPGMGSGPGRVTAHLYRGEVSPKALAKPAKPAAKDAAGVQTLGVASFKTDPNAPVDVESDQLDVDDTAKVAVFRGDVRAKQGSFEITSGELHAFYTGEASLADVTRSSPAPSSGRMPANGTELTRVEARNNVMITSKDGQTAAGDWANFDAKTNTAMVGGSEVVLTQGQNVVRGTRLRIDMTSGASTIDTAPPKTVAEPAGQGWVTEAPEGAQPANRGRPNAIFFPLQMKEANDAKKSSKTPAKDAPDGWVGGTTQPGPVESGN